MSILATSAAAILATSVAAGALGLLSTQVAADPTQQRAATEDTAIRPFRINIPEEALVDLRRRIVATRWPDKETVPDQSQGIQLTKIKPLVEHWGSGYDWRKAEAKLNALPQFMTTIDGVDIHFIHVRSRASKRAASDHDPWLAGINVRAAQDRRPTDGSPVSWWACGGRLRSRSPLDAWLRLLRQADGSPVGVPSASREPGRN